MTELLRSRCRHQKRTGRSTTTPLCVARGEAPISLESLNNATGLGEHPTEKKSDRDAMFSPHLYRARNLVERFLNKIKHCRRVATRYDKLAANYLAFVQLASIRLWLRANESTS